MRDTGIGIAEADQARIFEAFQRGDRRVSVEGTGLGLTLSKRFVELHGGRVWVASAVGEGSTFGFAIPLGARPSRCSRPREPRPDGAGDRGRPPLGRAARALPRRLGPAGGARARRRRRARAGARAAPARGDPRHPAPAPGRLGPAGAAQERPGHRRHPGRDRVDARRARERARARARSSSWSSRSAARRCSTRWRASCEDGPDRRGQPAQPQAGARRARPCGLRDARGAGRRGRASRWPASSAPTSC